VRCGCSIRSSLHHQQVCNRLHTVFADIFFRHIAHGHSLHGISICIFMCGFLCRLQYPVAMAGGYFLHAFPKNSPGLSVNGVCAAAQKESNRAKAQNNKVRIMVN
jgi:hypothetical protein